MRRKYYLCHFVFQEIESREATLRVSSLAEDMDLVQYYANLLFTGYKPSVRDGCCNDVCDHDANIRISLGEKQSCPLGSCVPETAPELIY